MIELTEIRPKFLSQIITVLELVYIVRAFFILCSHSYALNSFCYQIPVK